MKVVYLNQHSQSNMSSSPTPIVLALGFFDTYTKVTRKSSQLREKLPAKRVIN
ncbi:hypothetical protein [Lentilactobacillus buchneri]|uniref:hypothetical protein n=1 Tax=Lentilactobacillus buchneri TaxID=1581 RepID=UPI001CDB6EBA|nr:hypothetical protein [Lentilactobacillus buchneri]